MLSKKSYQKNDKFVTNKTKICLFYLFLFYEVNTKLLVDSFYFSSYPFRTKLFSCYNMRQSYSQF